MPNRQFQAWAMLLICFLFVHRTSLHAQTGPMGVFEGQTDVGSVTPSGVLRFDAASGVYALRSAGENLWSTHDDFHFVWKKMSGDVSVTAGIEFPTASKETSPHRKAVLMFRQTLESNAVYVDAAQHGSGMTALQYRRAAGATTQDIELDLKAVDRLRIEKRADSFTMFMAGPGEKLHQAGASINLKMEGPFYVGIGVCSHNTKLVEEVVFRDVQIETLKAEGVKPMALYSTLQTIGIEDNYRRAMVVYTTRGHMEAPNWTKDGRTLLFNQDGKIFYVSATGGETQPLDLGEATHCNGSHGLSPDGKLLAISCSMPGKPESRVYVVPAEGGTPRIVTEKPNSYFHTWSPDGRTIVFTRPKHGSGTIYAISAHGGEERALTSGDGISDDPDYSPDGRFIYFNSDRGGTMEIWRMRPDGSQAEQMTFDDMENWTPHNSPDGKSLIFISYEKGTKGHPANKEVALRLFSTDEHADDYKTVRTIVNITGGSGTMNVASWAPDGKHFAFVSYQMLPADDTRSSE